jgi:hypothetical protein
MQLGMISSFLDIPIPVLPREILSLFDEALAQEAIPAERHVYCRKWLCYYPQQRLEETADRNNRQGVHISEEGADRVPGVQRRRAGGLLRQMVRSGNRDMAKPRTMARFRS